MVDTGVERTDSDGSVHELGLDSDGHGVAYAIAHLETRSELGTGQQNGTPVIPPRSKASLLKVGAVRVLTRKTVEPFLVDEPGVIANDRLRRS